MAIFRWFQWMREKWFGTRVITPEEIEGYLHLPVVAIIPHIERRRGLLPTQGPIMRRIDLEGRWRSRLLIHFPKEFSAAAPYTALAAELHAHLESKRQKVWLVAAGVTGEGASLSCMNLAIAAQRQGIKTLIIEGHTRAPRISSVFRLELEPGLTGCINRALSASQAIQKSSVADVDVLPAGRPVPSPQTLWGTPTFLRLLAEARSLYELVLFEGPPILEYPDVGGLADKVDGILLVHQFGRSSYQRIEDVLDKLGHRKEKVLGLLLNDVPMS